MARIRYLKPSFFDNDRLAECEPLARLLFAGLWTLADREGKLEDKPKMIKKMILGYDNCDIEQLLGQLETKDFIIRYSIENENYIYIPKFLKHQRPHSKESPSEIPFPDKKLTGNDKHRSRSLQAPIQEVTSTDPDDCEHALYKGMGNDIREWGMGNDIREGLKTSIEVLANCPHQEIISLYLETLPELPCVEDWNKKRQSMLQTRWKEKKERQNLDWWKQFFTKVKNSDFLCGRTKEPFKASLVWLIKPENFLKVLEGNYDNRASPVNGNGGNKTPEELIKQLEAFQNSMKGNN